MEDGEIDSKVGVSIMFGVYCLVQVDAEDSVVTITEETPTDGGDKVGFCSSVKYIWWLFQEEKCFCAKANKCPTISEASENKDHNESPRKHVKTENDGNQLKHIENQAEE